MAKESGKPKTLHLITEVTIVDLHSSLKTSTPREEVVLEELQEETTLMKSSTRQIKGPATLQDQEEARIKDLTGTTNRDQDLNLVQDKIIMKTVLTEDSVEETEEATISEVVVLTVEEELQPKTTIETSKKVVRLLVPIEPEEVHQTDTLNRLREAETATITNMITRKPGVDRIKEEVTNPSKETSIDLTFHFPKLRV